MSASPGLRSDETRFCRHLPSPSGPHGGLKYLETVNPGVKIYAPIDGFGGVFGSLKPGSFYRKAEALPPEMRYFDGNPPSMMKTGSGWPGANFELVDNTTEVSPGMTLIAVVSDVPGTKELKDKWKVDWIAPGHCTGEPAFLALKQAFGERYLYAGLGTVLELGATSPASTTQAATPAMER
jgi:hypothetical protein